MSDKKIITTDQPLTIAQSKLLSALLDTLVPPSDDNQKLGAGELDLVAYLEEQEPEAVPLIKQVIDSFEDDFFSSSLEDRYQLMVQFSLTNPSLFKALLFHTYAMYYQDDRVMAGIGLVGGAPFPRGNDSVPGDLSLLDQVVENTKGYRRVGG